MVHPILVLDEHAAFAEKYDRVLKAMPDVEVVFFVNPFEALKWLERHKPALVILDYRMPGMDGVQFIRRVRTRYAADAVPIVMLTGVASPVLWQMALDEGANDYFIKPVDPERFIHAISRLTRLQ